MSSRNAENPAALKPGIVSVSLQDLLLIGVFLLPVFIYWPTAVSVFEVWMRSDTFAHGIVVFPLALYLLFKRRDRLSGLKPQPSLLGFIALFFLSLGWYASALANADVVQQLSLAMMMSASVLLVFGARISFLLLFPLLYVLFAVPIGEFLISPLMDWTADFTVFALQVTGIPVFREGLFFKIPSGNFEVAKACSGIRYLIASIALGTLFANMVFTSWRRQLLFVGISVALPILANWLRAYGIVVIAHLSDLKLAVGIDHIIYGWLFFGLVMFLMFSFGWWLKGGEDAVPAVHASPVGSTATVTGGSQARGRVILVLAVLVIIAPRVLLGLSSSQTPVAESTAMLLPAGQGDWQGPLPADAESWMPFFANSQASGRAEYRKGSDELGLFVATYDAKNRASEMVSWENTFIVNPWKAISTRKQKVSLDGKSWIVKESLISKGGSRKLLWYWYETDSIRTSSDAIGKLAEALAALPLRHEIPRAVALAITTGEDVGHSRQLLDDFLARSYGQLQTCVAEVMREPQSDRPSNFSKGRCQAVARL